MARKRMISPEIWDSQSFGELSLLAKILFIGMISHADDDGKGILNSQYLKSRILPYDVVRIADVDTALSEIGQKTSVTYYEVEGKSYYKLETWSKWQLINRPTPSKLPDPAISGEGEELANQQQFTEHSLNTHGTLTEYSCLIERKGIEKERERNACARERLSLITNLLPNILLDTTLDISEEDTTIVANEIRDSEFLLKTIKNMSFIQKNFEKIKAGAYRTFKKASEVNDAYTKHNYTQEQLNSVLTTFDKFD